MLQNQISIESMKDQAKVLHRYLNEQEGVSLPYSKSLEAVSRGLGFKDWNTASGLVSMADKLREEDDGWLRPGVYTTKEMVSYMGWQQVGGLVIVPGRSAGVLTVIPTVCPYFEPKAVYLFGTELHRPSINRRFTVGAITVGGSPQLAINTLVPSGGGDPPAELLSDVFSRSEEPLLVNWSVFSTPSLERKLQIYVFNLNEESILVSACIWGNAVVDLETYA